MSDYDARLVGLYDTDNPDGPDHDFYRALADEIDARSIVDLGCGTGLLTVTLARGGREVIGIDPSLAMLDYARRRPGAQDVTWVLGDSSRLPAGTRDYAVMTGNVVQHIPDPAWETTLRDLRAGMRGGGVLAFESRNPAARAWELWTSETATTRPTSFGPLREWSEAEEFAPGQVRLTAHNLFEATGENVTETLVLAFRDATTLRGQLAAAGFRTDAVYGDWHRAASTNKSALMVFVARAV